MLKKISNLTGVTALSKDEQKNLKGGLLKYCYDGYCYTNIYGEACDPHSYNGEGTYYGCTLGCCEA